jgi:hypothetical protein
VAFHQNCATEIRAADCGLRRNRETHVDQAVMQESLAVFSLKYHVVPDPKYLLTVLVQPVDVSLKTLLKVIADVCE